VQVFDQDPERGSSGDRFISFFHFPLGLIKASFKVLRMCHIETTKMHNQMDISSDLLLQARGQTTIITGSARGIGAATASLLNDHGANVVIADLPNLESSGVDLIQTLKHPNQAIFVKSDVTDWRSMVNLFKEAIKRFGQVDIVIANAGIMERSAVLDISVDDLGDPLESIDATRVLDVNLKGTLNSEPTNYLTSCVTIKSTLFRAYPFAAEVWYQL
jgi:hypothetical protein